jgi:hypothetical protein
VTAWVAVVYDVLQKLDELALAGDKTLRPNGLSLRTFARRWILATRSVLNARY